MGVVRQRLRQTGVYFGVVEPDGHRPAPAAVEPVRQLLLQAVFSAFAFGLLTWLFDGAHAGRGIGDAVARGILFGVLTFVWAYVARRHRLKRDGLHG